MSIIAVSAEYDPSAPDYRGTSPFEWGGERQASVSEVAVERCEGALPFAVPFGEQLVGRRLAAGHGTDERREIDRLVVAPSIDQLARPESGMGDLDHVARQFGEH